MGEPLIAGFGFATIGERPDLSDLDRALGRIEDVGASHVELAFFAADLIAGGRVLPEPRRRLEASCAAGAGWRYTAHGTLAVNFMDEANLDLHKAVCRANLELAAAVGATVLVHHPGVSPGPTAARAGPAARASSGRPGARWAIWPAALGVRLAVETLFVESEREYTADPVRLAAELRAVDHPHVVGTLDVSHSYLMTSFRGTSFTEAIAAFAPVTGHFHLHDSFGRPPGTLSGFYTDSERVAFGVGDLHLPFGWGDIPFETLLPGLPVLPGTVLTVELPERYWAELDACAAFARAADGADERAPLIADAVRGWLIFGWHGGRRAPPRCGEASLSATAVRPPGHRAANVPRMGRRRAVHHAAARQRPGAAGSARPAGDAAAQPLRRTRPLRVRSRRRTGGDQPDAARPAAGGATAGAAGAVTPSEIRKVAHEVAIDGAAGRRAAREARAAAAAPTRRWAC